MTDCKYVVLKASIIIAAVCFLAACGPEKEVQWSPDGKQAAVISDNKLYLCDDQGNLSSLLAEEVERVAWLPDSKRLAVVISRKIHTWKELVQTAPLDFDEKKIAAAAPVAREEFLSYGGDPDKFRPSNAGSLTLEQWVAATLFIKDHSDSGVKEKLAEKWKDLEETTCDVTFVRVMPAPPVEPKDGILLLSTLGEIHELLAAPDGGVLALVTKRTEGWGDYEERSLLVASIGASGKPALVADRVSQFPDWSPDGRELVFVRSEAQASGSEPLHLGSISRRSVRDVQGAILRELPEAKDLAVVLFNETMKVRCLPDGRVLFSAPDVSLPSGTAGLPSRQTLFFLDPKQLVSVSRVFPHSVDLRLPDRVDLFELSPDQKRVAIPGSKGRASVVTLATGEIVAIIEQDTPNDLGTVPVWRNNDQLCLTVPAGSRWGSSKRNEVVLWSSGKATIFSKSWPDSVIAGVK